MKRFIFCSAFILALLFPSSSEAHICKPPKSMDGENGRHQQQLDIALRYEFPLFDTGTVIGSLIEQEGNTLVRVPYEGKGFRTRGIGMYPGCRYPRSIVHLLYYVHDFAWDYMSNIIGDFEMEFTDHFIDITGIGRTTFGNDCLWNAGMTPHKRSPHQYGISFDISWRTLSHKERCWILDRLETDQNKKYVVVVDETTNGKHLHITIYPDWLFRKSITDDFPIDALLSIAVTVPD